MEPALVDAVYSLASEPYRPETWQFLLAFGRPALAEDLQAKLDTSLSTLDLARLITGGEDAAAHLKDVAEVAHSRAARMSSSWTPSEVRFC